MVKSGSIPKKLHCGFQEDYAYLEDGAAAKEGTCVSVAGRIMASRVLGKLAFFRLMDDSGSIQVLETGTINHF